MHQNIGRLLDLIKDLKVAKAAGKANGGPTEAQNCQRKAQLPLSLWVARTALKYLHSLMAEEAAPETAVPNTSDAARRAAATSEEQLVGHTIENFNQGLIT